MSCAPAAHGRRSAVDARNRAADGEQARLTERRSTPVKWSTPIAPRFESVVGGGVPRSSELSFPARARAIAAGAGAGQARRHRARAHRGRPGSSTPCSVATARPTSPCGPIPASAAPRASARRSRSVSVGVGSTPARAQRGERGQHRLGVDLPRDREVRNLPPRLAHLRRDQLAEALDGLRQPPPPAAPPPACARAELRACGRPLVGGGRRGVATAGAACAQRPSAARRGRRSCRGPRRRLRPRRPLRRPRRSTVPTGTIAPSANRCAPEQAGDRAHELHRSPCPSRSRRPAHPRRRRRPAA